MKKLAIELPDFAQMGDDQLNRHHISRGRDGRWSMQTKALLEHFDTEKLQLNAAWAATWTDWSCPCCGRTKREIARLTQSGVLLCQLESHHDHLDGAIDEIFRVRHDEQVLEADGKIRSPARNAVHLLVERFERTLICGDCNTADAKMKAALGDSVPRRFSFSPGEIAQFVVPKSNSGCDIDFNIGRAVWEVARLDFEARHAFANMLADRICNGKHDKERGSLGGRRFELDDREIISSLIFEESTIRTRPFGMGSALSGRSCSNDGNSSSKRLAPKSKPKVPTDAEFSNFDASQQQQSAWAKASPAWSCATCGRGKREIMRKSNRGVWTGALHTLCDYVSEDNWENIERRRKGNDLPIVHSSYRKYQVCQDCRLFETEAGKLIPTFANSYLSKEAIKRLAGNSSPNQRHSVEFDILRMEVEGLSDWIDAVCDFWLHRSETSDAYFYLYRAEIHHGHGSDIARLVALQEWADKHGFSGDTATSQFGWLLNEYERLKQFDDPEQT